MLVECMATQQPTVTYILYSIQLLNFCLKFIIYYLYNNLITNQTQGDQVRFIQLTQNRKWYLLCFHFQLITEVIISQTKKKYRYMKLHFKQIVLVLVVDRQQPFLLQHAHAHSESIHTTLHPVLVLTPESRHHTHPLVVSSLKFIARFDIGEFILLFCLKNKF